MHCPSAGDGVSLFRCKLNAVQIGRQLVHCSVGWVDGSNSSVPIQGSWFDLVWFGLVGLSVDAGLEP